MNHSTSGFRPTAMNIETMSRIRTERAWPSACHRPQATSTPSAAKKPKMNGFDRRSGGPGAPIPTDGCRSSISSSSAMLVSPSSACSAAAALSAAALSAASSATSAASSASSAATSASSADRRPRQQSRRPCRRTSLGLARLRFFALVGGGLGFRGGGLGFAGGCRRAPCRGSLWSCRRRMASRLVLRGSRARALGSSSAGGLPSADVELAASAPSLLVREVIQAELVDPGRVRPASSVVTSAASEVSAGVVRRAQSSASRVVVAGRPVRRRSCRRARSSASFGSTRRPVSIRVSSTRASPAPMPDERARTGERSARCRTTTHASDPAAGVAPGTGCQPASPPERALAIPESEPE